MSYTVFTESFAVMLIQSDTVNVTGDAQVASLDICTNTPYTHKKFDF